MLFSVWNQNLCWIKQYIWKVYYLQKCICYMTFVSTHFKRDNLGIVETSLIWMENRIPTRVRDEVMESKSYHESCFWKWTERNFFRKKNKRMTKKNLEWNWILFSRIDFRHEHRSRTRSMILFSWFWQLLEYKVKIIWHVIMSERMKWNNERSILLME